MNKFKENGLTNANSLFDEIDHPKAIAFDYDKEEEVINAIKRYNEIVEKVNFKSAHKLEDHNSRNTIFRWIALPIAASLILFLILNKGDNQNNFDQYFTHYDEILTTRFNTEADYNDAIEAYSNRQYKKALGLFQEIPQEAMTDELKFYAGVSALGSEEVNQAINLFETIGIEPTNRYYQQTKWYLALSYWQAGQTDKGLAILMNLSPNEFKYKEAQKVIQLIDNQ